MVKKTVPLNFLLTLSDMGLTFQEHFHRTQYPAALPRRQRSLSFDRDISARANWRTSEFEGHLNSRVPRVQTATVPARQIARCLPTETTHRRASSFPAFFDASVEAGIPTRCTPDALPSAARWPTEYPAIPPLHRHRLDAATLPATSRALPRAEARVRRTERAWKDAFPYSEDGFAQA